jgi:hypothetical protein
MSSRQTAFLEIFMILSIVMGTVIILSVSVASAQTTPVKIGNPNDFRPGHPYLVVMQNLIKVHLATT